MAEVLIDESELHNHQRLTRFVQQALANPKTRKSILEAQKTLNPETVIPELDAVDHVKSELTAMREEMASLRAETLKEKEDREQKETLAKLSSKWEKGRDKIRAQGYSEDGIKAIEDLMEREGIANHDAGLAYFEKLNPPADPINVGSSRFDIFASKQGEDDIVKSLMESGGDESVFQQHLNKTIADIRSSRGSR